MGFNIWSPSAPRFHPRPEPRPHTPPPLNHITPGPEPTAAIQDPPPKLHRHAQRFHTEFYPECNATKWPADVYAAKNSIEAELVKLETIMKTNWEHKRMDWLQQNNKAIAETSWLEPNSLEDTKSDLSFPLFNELWCLPQKEQHWVKVLVSSATVERISSPTWNDIRTPAWSRTRGSETTDRTNVQPTISLGISFRFGFSQETVTLAIRSGLVNHISSIWTHLLIAEFVGPPDSPVPSPHK